MGVRTTDFVHDLDKLQDQYKIFDFSNLNKEHDLFSNEFNKIPVFLKIETPKSLYIDELVCLRSKCNSYTTELDSNYNTLKGICKGYKTEISFDQYYKCLKNETYDRECKHFCK